MKRYVLSVCKGVECRANGADAVYAACQTALAASSSLTSKCTPRRGGCYGFCERGPNVVIREERPGPKDPFGREHFQLMGWPGEHLYSKMTPEKALRLAHEHIGADAPVSDYLADAEAMGSKTPSQPGPGGKSK